MSSDTFSDDNTDLDSSFILRDADLSSSDTENNISNTDHEQDNDNVSDSNESNIDWDDIYDDIQNFNFDVIFHE